MAQACRRKALTPSNGRRVRFGLPLAAGLAVAFVWGIAGAGRGVLDVVGRANPVLVAGMLGLTASWLGLRFLRWQYMLRRAGVRIPVRGSLSTYLAALPGTATPAYVGELVRCYFIRKRYGFPFRVTATILVIERLMDVVALAVILALTTGGWWRLVALGVSVLAIGGLALGGFTIRRGLDTGTADRFGPQHVAVVFILSVILWTLAGLLVHFGAAAVGATIPRTFSLHAFSLAGLGGAASLMPAGIGTTGSILILELNRFGQPLAQAIAIVSLVRLASTGAALAVGSAFLLRELRRIRQAVATAERKHFDDIADEYLDQFPAHVWQHLIDRKLAMIHDALPAPVRAEKILDLGCGLGRQASGLIARGRDVVGADESTGLLRHARQGGVPVATADAKNLPFADNSFSGVYSIGVLHHLGGRAEQAAAYREILRVLRPGGLFLIHESNPRNPLFRLYIDYVFPLLKSIDEGTEWWIDPRALARLDGFSHVTTTYFTFLPDFVPRVMMRPLLAVQAALERSRLRSWSVHYLVVLKKSDAGGSPHS